MEVVTSSEENSSNSSTKKMESSPTPSPIPSSSSESTTITNKRKRTKPQQRKQVTWSAEEKLEERASKKRAIELNRNIASQRSCTLRDNLMKRKSPSNYTSNVQAPLPKVARAMFRPLGGNAPPVRSSTPMPTLWTRKDIEQFVTRCEEEEDEDRERIKERMDINKILN